MTTHTYENDGNKALKAVALAAASCALALLAAVVAPAPVHAAIQCPGGCYATPEACATSACGSGGTSCDACVTGCTEVANCGGSSSSSTPTPTTAPAVRRTRLTNPLGSGVTIETLAGRAVRGFIGLSGSFALLMFVYGGFMWVTSAGNPEKVKKGKQIFTYAVIGLVVIFGAYAFLTTFINALGTAGT
ncbi:MAG TPA: pilin [Patescibacteria group bacterium]|nr:pilin [Patescibacteria group bacterium]